MNVFWDVALLGLADNGRRFGSVYWFHHQGYQPRRQPSPDTVLINSRLNKQACDTGRVVCSKRAIFPTTVHGINGRPSKTEVVTCFVQINILLLSREKVHKKRRENQRLGNTSKHNFLPDTLIVTHLFKKFATFTKPENTSQCSQQLTSVTHP
jgi:hypothetical protein